MNIHEFSFQGYDRIIAYSLMLPAQYVLSAVGKGISRLHTDRDACKESTDTPREATFRPGTASKLKNGGLKECSPTVRDEEVRGSKSISCVALVKKACQMVFVAGVDKKPVPGTNFRKQMESASGISSEYGELLSEVSQCRVFETALINNIRI